MTFSGDNRDALSQYIYRHHQSCKGMENGMVIHTHKSIFKTVTFIYMKKEKKRRAQPKALFPGVDRKKNGRKGGKERDGNHRRRRARGSSDSIQVETISEPCVLYFPAAFPLVAVLLSTPNALLERETWWVDPLRIVKIGRWFLPPFPNTPKVILLLLTFFINFEDVKPIEGSRILYKYRKKKKCKKRLRDHWTVYTVMTPLFFRLISYLDTGHQLLVCNFRFFQRKHSIKEEEEKSTLKKISMGWQQSDKEIKLKRSILSCSEKLFFFQASFFLSLVSMLVPTLQSKSHDLCNFSTLFIPHIFIRFNKSNVHPAYCSSFYRNYIL